MRRIALFLFAFASIMPLFAEAFYKVTDHTTLQDGDLVLLAYEEGGIASADFASSKKFISTAQATLDANKILVEEPTPITLKKNGNAWNLYINNKPIGHNSNSSDLKENTTIGYIVICRNQN